jgi:acyl carrier protein
MSTWTKEQVEQDVLQIVKDMTQDFDFEFEGDIKPEAKFVENLAFESTDIVELIGAVEKKFQRRKLPFHKLVLKDGKYADFSIRQLSDFLTANLNTPA